MELISREVVLDTIPKMICTQSRVGKTILADFIKEWISNIESIPTIESRPEGKWEASTNGTDYRVCSNCLYERHAGTKYNYCPICGADMRETETWNTSKGKVEMPKGLFDKIYEDGEE